MFFNKVLRYWVTYHPCEVEYHWRVNHDFNYLVHAVRTKRDLNYYMSFEKHSEFGFTFRSGQPINCENVAMIFYECCGVVLFFWGMSLDHIRD